MLKSPLKANFKKNHANYLITENNFNIILINLRLFLHNIKKIYKLKNI